MKIAVALRRITLSSATALLLCASTVHAQSSTGSTNFEPVVGQAGKDVIWVPTPPLLVDRMLKMAQVTSRDTVVDLGSGDGRIAIAAARDFNARAYGLEFNPDMVSLSRRESAKAGVGSRATFEQADIYKADFSFATVVTMYLLPNINLDMRPIVLRMKPGTRVVSHQFTMGEWSPDDTADMSGRNAYLWIVPARVEGRWTFDAPQVNWTKNAADVLSITLRQDFQKISGHASPGNTTLGLRAPLLTGDRLRFAFVDDNGRMREFNATVNGDTMTGEARVDGEAPVRFTARRQPG
ncbi:MAG: class I SAM-dependent methyltransferase [Burkholderiales bacterium]